MYVFYVLYIRLNDADVEVYSFLHNDLLSLIGPRRCRFKRILTSRPIACRVFRLYRERLFYRVIGSMISLNHGLRERTSGVTRST